MMGELPVQDANGRDLKRGDRVLIPCRVLGVRPEGDACPGISPGGEVFMVAEHLSPTGDQHALTLPGALVVVIEPGMAVRDLREDSSAYWRGLKDGTIQAGELVLTRIQEAVSAWEPGADGPTLRALVQAALDGTAEALARVPGREGAEG